MNNSVINRQEIEKWCHKHKGSGRYTMNWLYSSILSVNKSVHVKTPSDKLLIKKVK